jgi:hypothetical protein
VSGKIRCAMRTRSTDYSPRGSVKENEASPRLVTCKHDPAVRRLLDLCNGSQALSLSSVLLCSKRYVRVVRRDEAPAPIAMVVLKYSVFHSAAHSH